MSEFPVSQNAIGAIGSRFIFNDLETAAMSIATAIGGSQLLIINRILGQSTTRTKKAIGATGALALGAGIAGLFEKIPMSRIIAVSLFGYGMSTIISIGIPIVASAISSADGVGSLGTPTPF
jgi:hypothetical protein